MAIADWIFPGLGVITDNTVGFEWVIAGGSITSEADAAAVTPTVSPGLRIDIVVTSELNIDIDAGV